MNKIDKFRVNSPQVIFEVIRDEAIILNFEQGIYYSLNESGMMVWSYVAQGATKQAILERVKQYYHATESAVIEADFAALWQTLETDQLIVPAQGEADKPAQIVDITTYSNSYEAPQLMKFTDLQSLLMLDPIHDTDQMGWPHQAA